jgi:hypothetical protein
MAPDNTSSCFLSNQTIRRFPSLPVQTIKLSDTSSRFQTIRSFFPIIKSEVFQWVKVLQACKYNGSHQGFFLHHQFRFQKFPQQLHIFIFKRGNVRVIELSRSRSSWIIVVDQFSYISHVAAIIIDKNQSFNQLAHHAIPTDGVTARMQ